MSATIALSEAMAVASLPGADYVYRALVAVSSPEHPLDPALFVGIDWQELLRQARHHSLSPLLAHRLLESPVAVPVDIRARLKRDFQSNLRRNFAFLEEALRVARAFREHQIDVIPYKGPVLAEQLWGSFTLRECSDVDFLVRRSDVGRTGDVLNRLGYRQVSPVRESLRQAFVRNASEEQFRHSENNIFLELQWAPAPRAMAVKFDEESLWRNKTKVDVAAESVDAPGAEDLFALLAIHGWKHNWSKLIWVADLARLIERQEIDWDRLHHSAACDGWGRILLLALAMVQRVYGLPESIRFEPDRKMLALAERLESYLRNGRDHSYSDWHRDMLYARDSRASQARQVFNFFLTPGLADYEAIELPAWASSAYRAIRVARLLRFGPAKSVE